MNHFAVDTVGPVMFAIAIKATLILSVVAIVQGVLRRRTSAAWRHLVWTSAIAAVLALPLASVILPAWPITIRTAPASTPVPAAEVGRHLAPVNVPVPEAAVTAIENGPAAPAPVPADTFSWTALAIALYLAGALAMLLQVIVQRWSAARLVRRATEVTDADWNHLLAACADRVGLRRSVRLLRSGGGTMPMAVGAVRAAILLPAVADAWDEDRRRAVRSRRLPPPPTGSIPPCGTRRGSCESSGSLPATTASSPPVRSRATTRDTSWKSPTRSRAIAPPRWR
jgi:beta-lactamase regulating signal transducer with metallopeptidase domain